MPVWEDAPSCFPASGASPTLRSRVPPPGVVEGWAWGEDRRGAYTGYRPETSVTDWTGDMGNSSVRECVFRPKPATQSDSNPATIPT